ncbi:MAG: cupin domain-containing protein [Acidimicrobiales bacterium]
MTGDRAALDDLTADEIVDLLALEPLPAEGGMWAQTWLDEHSTAIYFLLRPADFSAFHRLAGPELWHHYCGAAVDLVLLSDDRGIERVDLGTDLRNGERPVVVVPPGTWMAARTTGPWSLVGTTMSPPFDWQSFELGSRHDLLRRFPDAADEIRSLTRVEPDPQPDPRPDQE